MVQGTRPAGLSITSNVNNASADGYACSFLRATEGEVGQLYVGAGTGLNIGTNTAHPIRLCANRFALPQNLASIEISANSTRDVSMNTNATITGNATVGGTLTITGALTTTAFYANKPWVGFSCISNVIIPSNSPGFSQSGISLTNTTTGTYTFTIPAHPRGTNYLVFVQQQASTASTTLVMYNANVISATSFVLYSKTTASVAVASSFYVYTVP